jgi:hypothetical protein
MQEPRNKTKVNEDLAGLGLRVDQVRENTVEYSLMPRFVYLAVFT